jgi:flagellar basal-body rod protein FlgF
LALAPKRHDLVGAILALLRLSALFDHVLSNGGSIASISSELVINMDPLLISAASGMKARTDSLDMLANNMANSGTSGFKADREFYNLYEQSLPTVERQYTDFSQGQFLQTGNSLNAALNGKGFFALNSPSGIVYTRAGTFRVSTPANQLETAEGYTLRNVIDNGEPITVDPLQKVEIAKDGTVSQGGQTLGQIEIAQLASPSDSLKKLGSTYFALIDKNAATPVATDTEILQGQLEQSNVPVGESAVKLVSIMRQFEMMQKAINIGTEMNKQAITEVAKPN